METPGWEHLTRLGNRYASLIERGTGLTPGTRTREQICIAKEIVEGSYPFTISVAKRILQGPVRVAHGRSISLRGIDIPLEDLVQVGVMGIVENLHTYRTSANIRPFLQTTTAATMYRYGFRFHPMINLPRDWYTYHRAKNGEVSESLAGRIGKKYEKQQGLVAFSLEPTSISLSKPGWEEKNKGTVPSTNGIEQKVLIGEIQREVERIEDPRLRRILGKFLFEETPDTVLAEELRLSKERIRQLRGKGLEQLRKRFKERT